MSNASVTDLELDSRPSLTTLNKEAVAFVNRGEWHRAIETYKKLFRRVREENVTHAELYVCYGNRSAAWYILGEFEHALRDADQCIALAQSALQRGLIDSASHAKGYLRKGYALLGMERPREASSAFRTALAFDPCHAKIRAGLELATQKILSDLLEGKGKQTLCLPPAKSRERISNLAFSTPLHRIKTEDVLPTKLLTPQQAERDHHIRDTYNYVTIQTDIEMPQRSLRILRDQERCSVFAEAVKNAVDSIRGRDLVPRILSLGSGTGFCAMIALESNAEHVTIAERWLYSALSCHEVLESNGFTNDQYKVVYKRPTDLAFNEDVPVCCNVCINELLDEGLLTSGIIPAFCHNLDNVLVRTPILIPATATVYVQAIELKTSVVCGLDMSAVDQYRWLPFYVCEQDLGDNAWVPLSDVYQAWYFDFHCPPEESAQNTIDITFTKDGVFNAVLFWYDLDLGGGLTFSTNPQQRRHPSSSLGAAVQYLAGQLRVEADMTYPLLCSHNTVRMRFDIEEAEYLHLTKEDPSFPHSLFPTLENEAVLEAYFYSIREAYKKLKERDGRVDALDVRCGSGILGVMCAKAGCSNVVACDIHESMIDITQKTIARNGVSSTTVALCDDAANLKRGQGIPYHGMNLVVTQLFDSGLLGWNVLSLLECLRRNVMQQGAITIPYKAVVYCMGIEIAAPCVHGYKFSVLDKYLWDEKYTTVDLKQTPHMRHTAPVKVLEFQLDGRQHGRGRETIVRLVADHDARINAVAFWFDLYLNEDTIVTTAPNGISANGCNQCENCSPCPEEGVYVVQSQQHGQAVQYLDASVEVSKGQRLILIARRDGASLRFQLKRGMGQPVERAPWKEPWGGGASVENPHVQRTHYCQLLVNDFKMRCKGSRFPSIYEDLKIMERHCGSLFLDPRALMRIGLNLVVTEKLCQRSAPTPTATVEAVAGTDFCQG